jgi:hypothetical protein
MLTFVVTTPSLNAAYWQRRLDPGCLQSYAGGLRGRHGARFREAATFLVGDRR